MHQSNRAFTLIELLVVISIIGLLVGILLPTLGKARESSRDVNCRVNQRTLVQAFITFSTDHKGHLPGNVGTYNHPDPWKRNWLGTWTTTILDIDDLTTGTIYSYINQATDVYRCPSLEVGVRRSGKGSNGQFDYAAFAGLTGATIAFLPLRAQIRSGTLIEDVALPVFTEEDPRTAINYDVLEGHHGHRDLTSLTHIDHFNYASIDGSSIAFKTSDQFEADDWFAKTPSGIMLELGLDSSRFPVIPDFAPWAWWDRQ